MDMNDVFNYSPDDGLTQDQKDIRMCNSILPIVRDSRECLRLVEADTILTETQYAAIVHGACLSIVASLDMLIEVITERLEGNHDVDE